MQDDVKLIGLDDDIDESSWIQKGEMAIEGFDYMGRLWPLHVGKKYHVDIELQQLDFKKPEILSEKIEKIEQVGVTFAHYLYGHVKNNVLIVGDFKFDFEEFNEFNQYEGKNIKFLSDRINVTFLKELPEEILSSK